LEKFSIFSSLVDHSQGKSTATTITTCLYCVDGEYQQLQGSQANVQGMVLACRRCGNIQHFNPPYNGWNAWWMKR